MGPLFIMAGNNYTPCSVIRNIKKPGTLFSHTLTHVLTHTHTLHTLHALTLGWVNIGMYQIYDFSTF